MEQQTTDPAELIANQRAAGFDNIALPGTFRDLADVKQANAARGSTWFGAEEMKFFGTRYLTLHAGCVLSFADRNFDNTGLDYKVALLQRDGGVLTFLEPKFASRAEAKAFALDLVHALAEEPNLVWTTHGEWAHRGCVKADEVVGPYEIDPPALERCRVCRRGARA